jgi:hypothetical protein
VPNPNCIDFRELQALTFTTYGEWVAFGDKAKLDFGKHKDSTYFETYNQDPDYIVWVQGEFNFKGAYRSSPGFCRFATWLQKKPSVHPATSSTSPPSISDKDFTMVDTSHK